MANSKKSSSTEGANFGSLTDFEFDDGDGFFGIEADTLAKDKTVAQIKKVVDDDDEPDDDKVTSLEEDEDKGKEKGKGKKKEEEEDDKEEELDDKDFFKEEEEEKPKLKKKEEIKKKKEEEAEEEEEQEEEKEKDSKKKKTEEDDDNEDEEEEEKIFTALAEDLVEEGVFTNIKLPKGEKITKEKFFELQDAEVEARVEEALESFAKEMSDEGKAYLKFLKDGGSATTFITQYGSTLDIADFDEDNPAHIAKVIRHYLITYEKPEDEEALEDRIKYIKDGGKEKVTATRYYKTISKDDAERREAIVKLQEKAAEDRKNKAKLFNDTVREELIKTDKIGVFTITKADQKELANYINKPTVKVDKNYYIPEFQNEIKRIFSGRTQEDRKDLIILAKLVRDKFKLPDDLVTKVKTKVVSDTRSKLAEAKRTQRVSSSGAGGKKSLADYIDE